MNHRQLLNKQDCLNLLTEWQIKYILHNHTPAPTMTEVLQVKYELNSAYVKTLFYADKKVCSELLTIELILYGHCKA